MSILVTLWIIACGMLQWVVGSALHQTMNDAIFAFWLGTIWAGWSGSVWLSSAIPHPLYRLSLLFVVWLWHASLLNGLSEEPLLRYALVLGAYAVIQSIARRVFQAPGWLVSPLRLQTAADPLVAPPSTRQFSIFDLLLLMTALAAFIAGAKRYSPPGGDEYWMGLPIIFVMLLTLWGLVITSVSVASRWLRLLASIAVVISVFFGSYVTAEIEQRLRLQSLAMSLPFHMILYLTFTGWIMLLATIGQLEARRIKIQGLQQ